MSSKRLKDMLDLSENESFMDASNLNIQGRMRSGRIIVRDVAVVGLMMIGVVVVGLAIGFLVASL